MSALKVLLVDENKVSRTAIAHLLQQDHHQVESPEDMKSARAALIANPPEVIVFSWPIAGGAEFVKHVRASDESGHVYIIVVLDKQPPATIPALFAAGADDFMRRPVMREELLARVEAPHRIAKWSGARVAEAAGGSDWATCSDVRGTRACREMASVIISDLEQLLGGPMDLTEGWAADFTGPLRGAMIPLSLATEQTEVRISVAVEAASLALIGEALLGDPSADSESLDDVLREMANTAGGAIRRVGLEDNVSLTSGLPVNETTFSTANDLTHCWVATVRGTTMRIGLVGEILKKKNQRVPATRLKEGMVLAHDLKTAAGALLVPGGTRLTSTSAERVGRLLGERCLVEVACAA